MTLPISYFRFYFPEYVLKTRLPPNCATGFLDSLKGMVIPLDIHPLVVPSKIYYTPASFAITIFSHVGFLWRMTDVG